MAEAGKTRQRQTGGVADIARSQVQTVVGVGQEAVTSGAYVYPVKVCCERAFVAFIGLMFV